MISGDSDYRLGLPSREPIWSGYLKNTFLEGCVSGLVCFDGCIHG